MPSLRIVIYKIVTIHITFCYDPFWNGKCIQGACIFCEFHIHASFSFGMPFITLKAQKVKQMQEYLSFRSTASKSMLDIAGMGAIAPVIVSVGREHFPAVQTGGPIDGIRVLPNRLRIF